MSDLIKRLHEADLSAIKKACEILDGLPQDAIDGGWTARGISAYAKQLEADLAFQKQVTDAARQNQAELLERAERAEMRIAELEAKIAANADERGGVYAYELHLLNDEYSLVYAGYLERYATEEERACERVPLFR
jgi:hypothetical protein